VFSLSGVAEIQTPVQLLPKDQSDNLAGCIGDKYARSQMAFRGKLA
jgi:hypothetical protein